MPFAYDLHLGCMIARWKGIYDEFHLGGLIRSFYINEVSDHEKTSFGPSKWPKFGNQNN